MRYYKEREAAKKAAAEADSNGQPRLANVEQGEPQQAPQQDPAQLPNDVSTSKSSL